MWREKIRFADQEKEVQDVVPCALERTVYVVCSAANGQEALEMIRASRHEWFSRSHSGDGQLRSNPAFHSARMKECREDLMIRHVDEVPSSGADRERELEGSRLRPPRGLPPFAFPQRRQALPSDASSDATVPSLLGKRLSGAIWMKSASTRSTPSVAIGANRPGEFVYLAKWWSWWS
jgi:CheY-like chemotaxis protein